MSDSNLNQSDTVEADTSQSESMDIKPKANKSEMSDSEADVLELDTNQMDEFISIVEKNIKDKAIIFKTWQNEVACRRKLLYQRSKALLEQKKYRLKVYEDITGTTKRTVQNVQ